MAWNESERRDWLFPPVEGEWEGFRLEYLDPSDPDDRSILIGQEHPEFWRAVERGEETIRWEGEEVSPRMHMILHEVIANQIWDGEPPLTWQTAERLTALGYDRHEVLHMLAGAMSGEIWRAAHDKLPHDPAAYAEALSALPGSWEAQRPQHGSRRRRRHR